MILLTFCTSRATAEGAWVAAGQRGRPDHRPHPCQLRQDPGKEEGQEASRAGKVGTASAGTAGSGSAVSTSSGYGDRASLSLCRSASPRGAAGVCVQRNSSILRKRSRHDWQQQHKHCSRKFWETWFVSVCLGGVTDSCYESYLPKSHPNVLYAYFKFRHIECWFWRFSLGWWEQLSYGRREDMINWFLFCFVFLIDGECVRYRLSMTVFFCSFSWLFISLLNIWMEAEQTSLKWRTLGGTATLLLRFKGVIRMFWC